MKYRSILGTIAFIFMIGIASAGFLSYYGIITGTAEVSGPRFYAGSNNKLLVNEEPEGTTVYDIEGGGYEFKTEQFTSEDLNSPTFYPIKATMFVKAKMNVSGSENLGLEFGFYNGTGGYGLCSTNVQVSGTGYNTYSGVCNATVNAKNVDEFYYLIQEQTPKSNVSYSIKADGKTKVKVTDQ